MFPLVMGIIGFLISIRGYLAHRKLGPVDVTLEQRRAGGYRDGGQEDQLEITVKPTKAVATRGAKVTFVVREEVVKGSGSNSTTHKHTFIEDELALSPMDDGSYVGRLTLPSMRRPTVSTRGATTCCGSSNSRSRSRIRPTTRRRSSSPPSRVRSERP